MVSLPWAGPRRLRGGPESPTAGPDTPAAQRGFPLAERLGHADRLLHRQLRLEPVRDVAVGPEQRVADDPVAIVDVPAGGVDVVEEVRRAADPEPGLAVHGHR